MQWRNVEFFLLVSQFTSWLWQITGQPSVLYYAGPILQVRDGWTQICPLDKMLFLYLSLPNLMIFFVILIFKTAGFSAAADATRVSVVIGVFKVCLIIFSRCLWTWGKSLSAFIPRGNANNDSFVIVFLLQLLMTWIAILKVDNLGRRPLLIGGVSGIVYITWLSIY